MEKKENNIKKMAKTVQELEAGFIADIEKLNCKALASYNAPYTGNIPHDFAMLTLMQSGDPKNGYRGDDPDDDMAKYPPPLPYKDGKYYHTVMDIGWPTYQHFFPKDTPMQFYEMTVEKRAVCISALINSGKITTSNAVNILITFIIWGGSLDDVLKTYYLWYSTDSIKSKKYKEHVKFIKNDTAVNASDTFIKLIDVRRFVYNHFADAEHFGLGWERGILNFYRLFKNYL